MSSSLNKAEEFRNMTEHKCPIQELYTKLGSNPEKGLTDAQAS